MNVTRIIVYGRSRYVRGRTRAIGFEADTEAGENIEAATMILQDRVDKALADWVRTLDAAEAEIEAEQRKAAENEPLPF